MTIPLTDLKLYYKLDETSGVRVDSVGNANLADNNSVGYDAGKLGNAASFDGADWLQTADISTLLNSTNRELAFSAWLYFPNSTALRRPIALYYNASSYLILSSLKANQGTLETRFISNGSGVITCLSNGGLSNNTWYHIVARCLKQTTDWRYSVFINAVEQTYVEVVANGIYASTTNAHVRLGQYNGAAFYNGLIDEVAVFAGPVTNTMITELYNSGNGITYPFSSQRPVFPKLQSGGNLSVWKTTLQSGGNL